MDERSDRRRASARTIPYGTVMLRRVAPVLPAIRSLGDCCAEWSSLITRWGLMSVMGSHRRTDVPFTHPFHCWIFLSRSCFPRVTRDGKCGWERSQKRHRRRAMINPTPCQNVLFCQFCSDLITFSAPFSPFSAPFLTFRTSPLPPGLRRGWDHSWHSWSMLRIVDNHTFLRVSSPLGLIIVGVGTVLSRIFLTFLRIKLIIRPYFP